MRLQITDNKIKTIFVTAAKLFADYELYAVGGFPRDILLQRETCDIDFATSATPDQIEEILLTVCPYDSIYRVGKRFGTLGCMADRLVKGVCFPLEFTTFRTDAYDGESRKPQVQFVNTLKEDLLRRDFTVNALALNIKTLEVIDYFGGLNDLGNGIIQTPMAAQKTFEDDPLRMLRAIRFVAALGFNIEEQTLAAIIECASEIKRVSVERVMVELNKILLSSQPSNALRLFVETGLAAYILPELLPMVNLAQNSAYHMKNVFEHTLSVVDNTPPVLHLRLAALLHDIGKPETYSCYNGEIHFYHHEFLGKKMAKNILGRLRYPALIKEQVEALIGNHMRLLQTQSTKAVRRLTNDLSDTKITLDDLLTLGQADITSSKPGRIAEGQKLVNDVLRIYEELQKEHEDIVVLPLNGNEIMELLDITPSKAIGYIKQGLEELILAEILSPHDKKAATQFVFDLYTAYQLDISIECFVKKLE